MTPRTTTFVACVLPVRDGPPTCGVPRGPRHRDEKRPDLDFEFVYVDDGSRDESLDLLLEFREADRA